MNTSLDRVHYLVSIVVWKDSDLDDALPLDYFGFKPFYAGKIVNGLLDPDTDRLLDFQGASSWIDSLDINLVRRKSGEYFLIHQQQAAAATQEDQ